MFCELCIQGWNLVRRSVVRMREGRKLGGMVERLEQEEIGEEGEEDGTGTRHGVSNIIC